MPISWKKYPTKKLRNAYYRKYHKKWRERNRKAYNKYSREYTKNNLERVREIRKLNNRKFYKRVRNTIWYKIKSRARSMLNRAIVRGRIKRGKCVVCGKRKVEGHHSDYSKPLKVIWVCRLHHARLHAKLKKNK